MHTHTRPPESDSAEGKGIAEPYGRDCFPIYPPKGYAVRMPEEAPW
jgi:hypothetical protein